MNILEDYEILSVIGKGTFGVAKLGKIKGTDEEVAIKILEKDKIVNKDDEKIVEREIDILKRVHISYYIYIFLVKISPKKQKKYYKLLLLLLSLSKHSINYLLDRT